MSGRAIVLKEVRKPLKRDNDFVCLQQILFDYNNGGLPAGPMFRFIRRDLDPPHHMKAQRSGCFFYDLDTALELLNAMNEELQWNTVRASSDELLSPEDWAIISKARRDMAPPSGVTLIPKDKD